MKFEFRMQSKNDNKKTNENLNILAKTMCSPYSLRKLSQEVNSINGFQL